jgi:3-polyprenyl-4-hydroxybenzoate decarboxylase
MAHAICSVHGGDAVDVSRFVALVATVIMLVFAAIVLYRFLRKRSLSNLFWGLGLLMLAKAIVVFDETVDIQNTAEAYWQMLGNVDWARDVVIQEGPMDALDHASYRFAYGGKIGIDATAKGPMDGYNRQWPQPAVMAEAIKELVTSRWEEYGFSGTGTAKA